MGETPEIGDSGKRNIISKKLIKFLNIQTLAIENKFLLQMKAQACYVKKKLKNCLLMNL